MTGQDQADHHPDGIYGEDHRDHERREPVPRLIQGIQRCRDGGERHRDEEGERDHPEPEVMTAWRMPVPDATWLWRGDCG